MGIFPSFLVMNREWVFHREGTSKGPNRVDLYYEEKRYSILASI